jgi:endonuclease/exonuclease/phosphatase family metal-dependent hydrolase
VLTAGRVGATEVVQLPDRGTEDRAVICLDTDAQGPVLACSLHLVTGKHKGRQERLEQLARVAGTFNARAASRAVIVAGDFNTTPSGMGALTNPARGGRFFDVDPQNAATRGTKIDYILFDRNHFSNPSGGPATSRFSDHRVLTGQATRR